LIALVELNIVYEALLGTGGGVP